MNIKGSVFLLWNFGYIFNIKRSFQDPNWMQRVWLFLLWNLGSVFNIERDFQDPNWMQRDLYFYYGTLDVYSI